MSEIISSVYNLMKETGVKEGILFLDEINCVSETLAPCMLQFLQYKVFGQHKVPDGWIIVTAGNPPEYNKSVRDFDIVTWDRLKRIDVEPDYDTWKDYANKKGIHPSIMTYLAARKKDFYKVESTIDGKNFVTARGWDDLSEMITLYEENILPVDEDLICQYLQNRKISKDFSIYYDLFRKYRSDYQIDAILDGSVGDNIIFRAKNAPFDERFALLGLLFDAVAAKCKAICETEDVLGKITPILRQIRENPAVLKALEENIESEHRALENDKKASRLSLQKQHAAHRVIATLEAYKKELLHKGPAEANAAFDVLKEAYNQTVSHFKSETQNVSTSMDHAFDFCEKAFADGDEILLFVTELTAHYYSARFIGHYGNDKYYLHNKELQFKERQQEIEKRLDALDFNL